MTAPLRRAMRRRLLRRRQRPAVSGAGFQAVALGCALPRSALEAVTRHGLGGVDSGSLYALGGVLAGALWLLLLVDAVRADRAERIQSGRSPIYAEGPYRRELSADTDPQRPM